MRNQVIREHAKECGVHLWQVAERLGITDTTFSKRMRRELSSEERKHVLVLIDEIAAGREGG